MRKLSGKRPVGRGCVWAGGAAKALRRHDEQAFC